MVLSSALLLAGGAAQAATQTVWQGDAFVTVASSACTPSAVAAAGDYYRVVYRPKLAATDPAEGLAFFGARSVFLAVSAAATATLQGSGSYRGTYVSSHAATGGTTSAFQLAIAPATITATTQTVTVTGTLTNFFATTGCTITIRSALTLRP